MLWYKGWLETRGRLIFALIVIAYCDSMVRWGPIRKGDLSQQLGWIGVFWAMIPILLGGAGTKTQATFRSLKGLHGSTLFTLTLPVSRLRLLLVRAGVGWLEMAGVFLLVSVMLLITAPVLQARASAIDALANALTVTVCCTVVYCITVLLGTFLDDVWQVWGSLIATIALLFGLKLLPWRSFDLERAFGEASPFVTHALPWPTMCMSLIVAAVLFFIAVKIAEAREY
jgi:ABC-2 type transport system permease protein